MLFARRILVVAVLVAVAGLAGVNPVEAGHPHCSPPPCSEPAPVQVFLREGTLVIVGSRRHDVVTIRRFNGPTLGDTPTDEVFVNGSRRPVLTFPVIDLRTGRRVSSVFMDGNDGFDRLIVEDGTRWWIRTREVEERGTLRPAG